MTGEYLLVAREVYGFSDVVLEGRRKHFSEHFFLRADGAHYVLSLSFYQPERMAKGDQFAMMAALKKKGFGKVELPVKTGGGAYCHRRGDQWWVLKKFVDSDAEVDWQSVELIEEAAQTLAQMHDVGKELAEPFKRESERVDLGAYYVPATQWPLRAEKIAEGFHWAELSEGDARFVRQQLDWVSVRGEYMLERGREIAGWGLTHQDFRPVNLRVWQGHIVEVWDFDMAVTDCLLADLAFALLQYGGRECLFPDISLDLAQVFLRAYLQSRDIEKLCGEPDVLRWFLFVVVLKRLLLNYHIQDRVELLKKVAAWDWARGIE